MKSIFISVRTDSTRLPGKALKKIGGQTTIEYLINRLKKVNNVDNMVLCTTEKKQDEVLVELAIQNGIDFFQGSESDKLERWRGAAKKFDTEFFVTADGDDTFCEPYLIDLAFNQYERNNSSYIEAEGIICGAFTNGISTDALNRVCSIKGTEDTEMIWPYFKETNLFKIEQLERVQKEFYRDDIRLTLDYQEDLDFMNALFARRNRESEYLSVLEIISIIEKEKHLLDINYFRHQEWVKNQKENTKLILNET